MIVKNESDNIERCLNSIYKAVDEIIIVDTGSFDTTKDICLKYTNKIYDFKWINDFSKARNYAIKKAKYDYILWLDADDYLTNENLLKLINLKIMLRTMLIFIIFYMILIRTIRHFIENDYLRKIKRQFLKAKYMK